MIPHVREQHWDEALSAITLNPSSVLVSEDIMGRESVGETATANLQRQKLPHEEEDDVKSSDSEEEAPLINGKPSDWSRQITCWDSALHFVLEYDSKMSSL